MQQQVFFYAIILVIMYGIYKSRHDTIKADTLAANEPFGTKKWIVNSSVELLLSALMFIGVIIGVDMSEIMPEIKTEGILGAVAVGAGIPNVASRILMPIIAPLLRIKTPRKKIRDVINDKTNELDNLKDKKLT